MAQDFPEQIGRYSVLRPLRTGGMAQLYLATAAGPAGFEKEVVIKCIHPRSAHDPQFESMFIDEARIAARLRHGNIVSIFDFGRAEGRYFIAMEYVDGVDLSRILHRAEASGRPFPQAFALHVAKEVARGLYHAHTASDARGRPLNIVHRDVSPSNVLVTSDGEVKILDFGIAKAEQRLTQTTHDLVKGKLHYLSPEQALGSKLDSRSDIFSLGVVLFRMLSGQHPLSGLPQGQILERLAGKEEMPSLRNAIPDVEDALAELVDRTIAFDLKRRWSSSGDLADAISGYLNAHHPDFTPRRLARYLRAEFPPKKGVAARMKAQLAAFAGIPLEASRGNQPSQTPRLDEDGAPDGLGARRAQPGDAIASSPDGSPGAEPGVGRSSTLPMQQAVAAPGTVTDSTPGGEIEPGASPEPEAESADAAFAPPFADRVDASPGGQHEDASMPTYLGEASSLGSVAPAAARPRSAWIIAVVLGLSVAGGITWTLVGGGEKRRGDSSAADDRDSSGLSAGSAHRDSDEDDHKPEDGRGGGADKGTAGGAGPTTGAAGPASASSDSGTEAATTSAPSAEPPPRKRVKTRPVVKKKALATAAPPSTAPGQLLVRVDPWASVYVDGKLRGTAPMPPIALPPGTHRVRLVNPHVGRNETVDVVIRSGGTTRITRSWR